eukprot:6196283-Pleurochrysis_carterae.AAC.3
MAGLWISSKRVGFYISLSREKHAPTLKHCQCVATETATERSLRVYKLHSCELHFRPAGSHILRRRVLYFAAYHEVCSTGSAYTASFAATWEGEVHGSMREQVQRGHECKVARDDASALISPGKCEVSVNRAAGAQLF